VVMRLIHGMLVRPAFPANKLVELDRDEGAVRVETTPQVPEDPRSHLPPGRQMVSTQPFTSAHELAGSAPCE